MDDQQPDDIGFDLESALDNVSQGLNLGSTSRPNSDDDYNNIPDEDESEEAVTEEIEESSEVSEDPETPVVETKPAKCQRMSLNALKDTSLSVS